VRYYHLFLNNELGSFGGLMAAISAGRNFGPVFLRMWTKVHQIKRVLPSASDRSLQCRFPIGDILYVAINLKSRSCPKSCRNFDAFRTASFWARIPKFLTKFCKYRSPSNTRERSVTSADRQSGPQDYAAKNEKERKRSNKRIMVGRSAHGRAPWTLTSLTCNSLACAVWAFIRNHLRKF